MDSITGFIKKAGFKDIEITINSKKMKNPMELIEKLYPLKEDETLTNEEKVNKVREFVIEFME